MVLLIDNYDSFTYNLYQYLSELGEEPAVLRNDKFSLEELEKMNLRAIVISPGPGVPSKAGLTEGVIGRFAGSVPILGVCLGHQAIAEVFGGEIIRAKRVMHGKTDEIFHDRSNIFKGLPNPFTATRYHSLAVCRHSLPSCIKTTAWSSEGEIMGLAHESWLVFGVQFHPESIMTPEGKNILRNFLDLAGKG